MSLWGYAPPSPPPPVAPQPRLPLRMPCPAGHAGAYWVWRYQQESGGTEYVIRCRECDGGKK